VCTATEDKGGNTLTPYYQNLVIASYQSKDPTPADPGSCDLRAISISGDNNHLTGILYPPNELVGIEGSHNTVLGSLIARGFYTAGNHHTITAATGGDPPTRFISIRRVVSTSTLLAVYPIRD
jgi:hypothetical protein